MTFQVDAYVVTIYCSVAILLVKRVYVCLNKVINTFKDTNIKSM